VVSVDGHPLAVKAAYQVHTSEVGTLRETGRIGDVGGALDVIEQEHASGRGGANRSSRLGERGETFHGEGVFLLDASPGTPDDAYASSPDGLDQAFVCEKRDGLPYGHARAAIALREFKLGGEKAAHGDGAGLYLVTEVLVNDVIENLAHDAASQPVCSCAPWYGQLAPSPASISIR